MQSRRKWKRRYYNLRQKYRYDVKDIEQLYLDKIVAESRKIESKAEKYDLLVEKLKEDIKNNYTIKEYLGDSNVTVGCKQIEVKKYAEEILSFMEGEINDNTKTIYRDNKPT